MRTCNRDLMELILALLIIIAVILLGAQWAKLDAAQQWHNQCFGTIDQLTAALNSIPNPDSAKVIVAPSSRNVGGWLGSPYCLVFR